MAVTNGDWDECNYADDKRHGQGTRYYANGNIKYTGEWANNEFNGQGIYYWEDGLWYEGSWLDGNMNGQGTVYYTDGTIKTGTWENGKFIG